jgi:hypothetical protein
MPRDGIRFLLALFFASLIAASAFAREVAVLPFQLLDNRLFIPVSLDGHGPYSFILDTGSSDWGISQTLVRGLGLNAEKNETISGAGEGKEIAQTLHIASVGIGPAIFPNQSFYAGNFGALNNVIGFTRFDGVAGKPVFDAYAVDIDFETQRLRLLKQQDFTPPGNAIILPFEFYEQSTPLVGGSVEGVRGRFIVDLGDRSSLTLFGPFWRALHLDAAMAPSLDALTGYGVGGPIRGLVVRARIFRFGDAQVGNIVARLSLQKSGGFADPNIAGSIGTGVLKHFHVTFDYAHKRIVLVPTQARSDAFDRAGLWLGRAPNGFEIYDVIAGSPAAEAGLRVGDVVTAVDGKPVAKIDLFDLRERLADPNAPASIALIYSRKKQCNTARLALRELLPDKH